MAHDAHSPAGAARRDLVIRAASSMDAVEDGHAPTTVIVRDDAHGGTR